MAYRDRSDRISPQHLDNPSLDPSTGAPLALIPDQYNLSTAGSPCSLSRGGPSTSLHSLHPLAGPDTLRLMGTISRGNLRLGEAECRDWSANASGLLDDYSMRKMESIERYAKASVLDG